MSIRIGLRQLIESIILEEGFKDDLRYLVEKFPDHAADLESLGSKPKWIVWLAARFGEKPSKKETHPFEDAIETIKNFSKKDAAIGEKYRANPQFKSSIDEAFPLDKRSWNTPSDITTISADEMETILGLSERKKQRIKVNVSEKDMESDRVGKVGPWNLWMPTTRERSCKIAQYDPDTLKPKTTWCTARMAGSNLFYNYVAKPGSDVTLFYIIKDNPEEVTDWLSVGFVNGEPEFSGKDGSISVDRDNKGLTSSLLKNILGSGYEQIMNKLGEKNKSLGGNHPARAKVADAAKSLKGLKYLIRGVSAEESTDLKKMVLKSSEISPEVFAALAIDKDVEIRLGVAENKNTPPEVLATLAKDADKKVRKLIARNTRTPAEALIALSSDKDRGVLWAVAENNKAPTKALIALWRASIRQKDLEIKRSVAKNSRTPELVLTALSRGEDFDHSTVRASVAKNDKTNASILKHLSRDESENVRTAVAENEKTPIEVLEVLAGDKNWFVASAAEIALKNRKKKEALGESRLRQLIRLMVR